MTENCQDTRDLLKLMYEERDKNGDVTFLVGGQRIRAHRIILTTLSPEYKAQFDKLSLNQDEIRVPNASAAAFSVFLQFFYKKAIDLNMDNIGMVLGLAKQSKVATFVETCVKFLKEQIEANKLCIPYRLANLYDIEPLRTEYERHISNNTTAVFASDDFLRCDRDMLLDIMKMDSLGCTEEDAFIACITWAREHCKRIDLDDGPENLRAALGDAVYHIRFSSLSMKEFVALYKPIEGFFTADELTEIMNMMCKLKDFEPRIFNQFARFVIIDGKQYDSSSKTAILAQMAATLKNIKNLVASTSAIVSNMSETK